MSSAPTTRKDKHHHHRQLDKRPFFIESLDPLIHFWAPQPLADDFADWDPDAEPRRYSSGVGHTLLELAVRMRRVGLQIELGPRASARPGLVVVAAPSLFWEGTAGLPSALAAAARAGGRVVVIRSDVPFEWRFPLRPFIEVMPNQSSIRKANQFYLPPLPQRGLVPRDLSRPARVATVGLKANPENLPPAVADGTLVEALAALGVRFVLDAPSHNDGEDHNWHDFSSLDAVLCWRRDPGAVFRKPPTKLVNAWNAGCIPICDREPAYLELLRPDDDGVLADDLPALVAALTRINADAVLAERLLAASRARGAALAREVVAAQWAEALTGWANEARSSRSRAALGHTLGTAVTVRRRLRSRRRRQRVVLLGPHARDPAQWRVVERVCELLAADGAAVAPPWSRTIREAHRQNPQIESPLPGSPIRELRVLPPGRRFVRAALLVCQLLALRPTVVILTVEPHERVILDALAALTIVRRPFVLALAMENRVTLPRGARGWAIRRLWRRIDAVAAAATATVDSFRAAGLPATIPTTPLTVAIEEPARSLGTRAVHGGLRVGFVGRLVPEKGVLDLVAAVASCEDVHLVLAGPGPLTARLQQRAGEPELEGRLQLVGILGRPDVWRLLQEIDVLALLSHSIDGWSEQFGYVLAEAMAVGTPLLGSDSGGIAEVIGDAGIVVPEGSVEAAAAALRELRDDRALRERLGRAARARYLAEFSVDASADKLVRLIEDGKRRRARVTIAPRDRDLAAHIDAGDLGRQRDLRT